MATVDDKKIIFSMVGLNKTIQQNNKQVLKNIYLSFFYGAKIGIIGLNGSGKSTLLKIIAGLDKSYQGEVVFSPGYSVGYLAQEPYLDPTKTVKEIVMEGVQPIVDALAEYEEINQKFGLPDRASATIGGKGPHGGAHHRKDVLRTGLRADNGGHPWHAPACCRGSRHRSRR